MSTWVGALVKTGSGATVAAALERHGIAVAPGADLEAPWILVEVEPRIGSLGPPAFAEPLSRELETVVVAFALQTAGSAEEIVQFERGAVVRRLAYAGDGGGWAAPEGTRQAWESVYFFTAGESTAADDTWPDNLGDEASDADVARYEAARAAGDATPILDLLSGGSAWPLRRVCKHLGVDPDKPAGRFTPPRSRKPMLILIAIAVFFVGMFVLGALGNR